MNYNYNDVSVHIFLLTRLLADGTKIFVEFFSSSLHGGSGKKNYQLVLQVTLGASSKTFSATNKLEA